MLGALISGIVGAAGSVTKGTGEALSIGGKDIPLLNAAGEGMQRMGDVMKTGAGDLGTAISDMNLGAGFADAAASFRNSLGGLSSSLTPGNVENSVSLSRAVETPQISAPKTQYDVSLADLGSFSPSAGGSGGVGGASLGM